MSLSLKPLIKLLVIDILVLRKKMKFNDDEMMPAHENIDMVISHASGYVKYTFTRKNARNYIDSHRRKKMKSLLGNDASILMDYFVKKKLRDNNFFYAYSFNKDDQLLDIFWADGRRRAANKYFHDVIVLDSTYLTNR
jgi:hypothetical protein